ncbi:MAG TPA: carbamoyl phosphate synthase large subunit, partial [Gammaproteobacteria bacterium]|nr:carbamoyl phosphate synthase large subunit [Gammaproteobacteria bacterium]
GIVYDSEELNEAIRRAFSGDQVQVLVEECLSGWKEIEYEVVRDGRDNCVTVCNMENMDPMGIHTGESIVVAPSQTLNDEEYQLLRSVAIRTVRHLGIVGECNIQYALDPRGVDYRVIEVNARLSRSSALASKATGYPLAYVAAKIALGYSLPEIPNGITRRTTAFFEPALDYIVCKVPRWDLTKFHGAAKQIGSEMKSVGEVMAIGRTFPEVIQKALRMLDIGVNGLDPAAFAFDDLQAELEHATPRRIFAIAQAIRSGVSLERIHAATQIDRWFLQQLQPIVQMGEQLAKTSRELGHTELLAAKQLGFSDLAIEALTGHPRGSVRRMRHREGVRPRLAQIDTLAAEFPADTNYLYSTYHAQASDVAPSPRKKIMVLGSGVYRIGSSVEFDWCCVNAVQTAAALGYETIM